MAPNPQAASSAYQHAAASPLDQIVNGTLPLPPRHALLDRAVTLTRKTTVNSRRPWPEEETSEGEGYGYALGGEETAHNDRQPESSRQRVQDLRAARLSQQSASFSLQDPPVNANHTATRKPHSSTLISNAFRDSVASDLSFNSISGPDERFSMAGEWPAQEDEMADDPNRIAEAVRGLTLRRRQSIDTVRSSEFGEGGKWDRAWGGSDGEDEEDDDDFIQQRHAMADLDIGGRVGQGWGALDHLGQGQWQDRDEAGRSDSSAGPTASRLPVLQDAPGVERVVSLQSSGQSLGVAQRNTNRSFAPLGQGQIHRHDTMTSIMGDVGRVSPPPSHRRHQYRDSNATIGGGSGQEQDHRLSTASNTSTANAHVYVWPPTPAGSEHGGSSDERSSRQAKSQSGPRDTAQRYSTAMGIGQQATVEYAEGVEPGKSVVTASPSSAHAHPMSPSTALARPLESPILAPDGTPTRKQTAARFSSGHPTGRLPPQPPSSSTVQGMERYSDPNKPLSSPYGALGKARRRAIEEHDGRESIVSDLDVETLRLDGSGGSGGSEDWASRRGSVTSLGSFSSDKIREQRQRRSQASIVSSYSDKRSSEGRLQEMRSQPRDTQHRSWNGAPRLADGSGERHSPVIPGRAPPKRRGTGPDANSTNALPTHLASSKPTLGEAASGSSMRTNASSLTFATPTPEREGKKANVTVKGGVSNSQAERFLTLAITHHESGDLSRSAYYFERSAKVEGGCVVGMCMWGMALREGWGVRKDQMKGFDWIGRAAAKAGEMMAGSQEVVKSDAELKAIRSELKLSVYELGKCFCYGWGVKMDKPMALEYFELAAKLGDSDAQAEAGALLAAGKGCKKDLKKAAMYYRMAEAQGYDTVGLSWIHKDKYDPVPAK